MQYLPCGCALENGEFTTVCEPCAREVAKLQANKDYAASLTLEDRVAALEKAVYQR